MKLSKILSASRLSSFLSTVVMVDASWEPRYTKINALVGPRPTYNIASYEAVKSMVIKISSLYGHYQIPCSFHILRR